jgi:hypothetical protein
MPTTIFLYGSKVRFEIGAQSGLTLKTAPHVVGVSVPAARREASSGRDVLHIDLDPPPGDEGDVETRLLSPLFRNEVGVMLAGLTVGKAVKWLVLLGAAVGAEQAKEILLDRLRRLLRRLHLPGAESSPPSRRRRQSRPRPQRRRS